MTDHGDQPPEGEGGAVSSPVGEDAARMAAIKISEGFNLGYCRAKPGKGPMMHNHDTNETFIPMTDTWRCSWINEKGEVDFVDAEPFDVVSFPPGCARRFENVTKGNPNEEAILMFVIGGDGPRAEFTDESMKELEDAGVWPKRKGIARKTGTGSAHPVACKVGRSRCRLAMLSRDPLPRHELSQHRTMMGR
jgi:hypothetical protein